MNPYKFFAELKRRNVYKVAAAYAVVSWLLVQAASIVFPTFEAPTWTMKVLIAILAIGFPVAVLLAWAFEITPEGIVRAEDVPPNESITRRTGRKLLAATAVLAAIAAGLLVFQLLRSKPAHLDGVTPAPPNTDSLAGARPSIPAKSIAVLPFENLSSDKENAYFADGIQDEILTKLASIADLKVISRTSTAKYKSKPENLKVVSQELGAAKILEGSVQRAGDKLRVNVQLIDAQADSHIWAKSYDGEAKDIFNVETQVSQQVADALSAKLSPAEANTVAAAPAKDPAAYDLFLKGQYEDRLATDQLRPELFDQAAAWYRQAIDRDPNFALAIAALADNRLSRHWFIEKVSDTELAELKKLVEHAIALGPELAEAHIALGDFYYFGYRQYDAALAECERALQLQPNNSTAMEFSGYIYRRQGQWEKCLARLKKALEINPRSARIAANIAETYLALHMWRDGEEIARHSLELDPHAVDGMAALLTAIIGGRADANEAVNVMATFPPGDKLTSSNPAPLACMIGIRADTFLIARDFEAALKVWDARGASTADERRQLAAKAAIYLLSGDVVAAHTNAQKAIPLLETRLREVPDDLLSMTELSWAYLAAGRNGDAVKMAQQAAEALPPEKDALFGPDTQVELAEIKARAGSAAEAIAILRRCLGAPVESVFIGQLKLSPVWDPIRNDPAFQQLFTMKEHVGP